MKIMITGANGSIGSDLVNFFSKNNKVFAFYRTQNHVVKFLRNKNIKWIQKDLKDTINNKIKPDIIIHSAITHPFSNNGSYLNYINSNITSLINTIEFAKKNKIQKFFYLSSVKLYGNFTGKVLSENSYISNPDILGTTKLLAEKIVESQPFEFYNIRLPGTLSYLINNDNRPWLNFVINKMIKNEKKININNPNANFNNIIDTIEIFKLISFILKSKNKVYNTTFLFTASKPLLMKNILKNITNLTNSKTKIIYNKKVTTNFIIKHSEIKKLFNFNVATTKIIIERYIKELINSN